MNLRFCEVCGRDPILYCDAHDAYLCPFCDNWIEKTCGDPDCSHCPTRPALPSQCDHPDRHFVTH